MMHISNEKGTKHKFSSAEAASKSIAYRTISFLANFRGITALIAVFLLGVILSPRLPENNLPIFLTWRAQSDILFEYAEYGILATGMTLVILAGGIDLSVGSVLGFAATLFSLLMIGFGWSAPAAVMVTLMAGAVMGLVNGCLVARFRMQSFVATLAMMVAARGAAKLISEGIKVQPAAKPWYALQANTPPIFEWMTTRIPVLGLQPVTIIFLINILVMLAVVRYTRFGRQLYAIGGNEEAARLSGIRTGLTKIYAFTLCATMAAVAGISNATRLDLGDPEAGATYELDAIAAVVIGGTSLMGGQGGMFFTLIGTLIIGFINKILSLRAVPEHYRLLAKGAIIVAAVLIQQKKQFSK